MPTKTRGTGSGGFTVVELMVAAAITSLLIVVLVTVGGAALDAWGSARSFARYQSSARAALDMLDSDFRSVLMRRRLPGDADAGAPWFEVRYAEPAGEESAEVSLFAQMTDIAPGMEGDFSAVHYRVIDQNPGNRPAAEGRLAALYRGWATPEETLEEGLGAEELGGVFWAARDVGDPVHLVAANVVVLAVDVWTVGTDGVRRRVDRGGGGWIRVDRRLRVTWEGADMVGAPYRLAGVDFGVEVVSERGMEMVRDGIPPGEVPASERRVFSQYVPAYPES